ncbi:MAG: hypothetical protein IJE21_02060 [Alistipes sp.]|nr:hypothetical protein [Alistipes sp.]
MKRVANLMPRILALENLLAAYYDARRGKQHKEPVIQFTKNLYNNILELRDGVLNGTFKIGRYHYFNIYDPKQRVICAASFEERVLHHAIINVCKSRFEQHFISDTYASREGKGVYAAIDRARQGMSQCRYVAKLDVRKYFDSVSHVVLKQQLRRVFKDCQLLNLFDKIIDSYAVTPQRGIPIGNLTSQYFANFYLSFLDHYIKEALRVPVYVRYMDDMLLFGHSKEDLKEYVNRVSDFVSKQLSLTLKCPQLETATRGVAFLGYRISCDKIVLNRRSKIRFKRKIYKYTHLLANGVWDDEQYVEHIIPLLAFVRRAYTKCLRRSVCEKLQLMVIR